MRIASVLPVVLLVACAGSPQAPASPSSATPTLTSTPTPSIAPQSATELLECDADPSTVGGHGEDVAFFGAGETPGEALAAFLSGSPFVIPRTGYESLGRAGERHAFGFRAGGEVKVVLVISTRFADLIGSQYTAEELRTCPESEFGSAAEFNDERRVWTHETTGSILTDIPGPSHCGWQSARMLHVEREGEVARQYLRDPEHAFDGGALLERYGENVELPGDASFSGYRSPEGFELWFTDDDLAAYVVTPDTVERWPRARELIGCM